MVPRPSVSGMVSDEKNNPVPFASVGIVQNGSYVGGSISDEQGRFRISDGFKNETVYSLRISSVGYQPLMVSFTYPDTLALKNIKLKSEANMLATVNVIAQRPLVERKVDRYIVNVEGSVLANGNSALEVLQKSPGIWVDAEGSIKIRGNQSVMVMINDVVQRMSESDLAEYLRSLRSEDISKIEIIPNPPSEFEAAGSGGIIHIILKKAREDGLVGSVSSQYRQQEERPGYNGGLSLNYKLKDLYLSGSLSGGNDETDYIAMTSILYPDQSRYASSTKRYNNNDRVFFRVGAVYDLTKKQSLSLQTTYTVATLSQYFDTNINFANSSEPLTGLARSEWYRKPALSSTTVNYSLKLDSLGSSIKFIGDYVYSTKTELNNFAATYTIAERNSTFRNNTPNFTDLYSLQTDFTRMLPRKWEFKAGLKFAATKRDNEVLNEDYIAGNWLRNTGLSNRFIYNEYLSMAYGSLVKTQGKLSIKAGLRVEETRMRGNSITANETFSRTYLSLFPSLFITQQLNEAKGTSVFINYSRRLQRPAFSDLNPYRLQFDNYLTKLGNPDLMPEYTHRVAAGTSLGSGISADIYYTVTTGKIAELASPVSNNVIEYQSWNFNNSTGYGLSIDAQSKLNSWWSMNNSLDFYNVAYTLNDFRISQNTWATNSQHTAAIKGFADLDAGINYRSPYVNANTHVAHQLYSYFGVAKRMMNKHLLLRINVSDVLNTAREKDFTEYAGTRIDFYQKRPTRTFGLYLSYSFSSGKKFSDKKIEQSNEEERSRIGN
jgi:outer membrane receptor protein involved in Fe transport